MTRVFNDLMAYQFANSKFVCVGLDVDYEKIPLHIKTRKRTGALNSPENIYASLLHFCKEIILSTNDIACAYKANWAFYLQYGIIGLRILEDLGQFIPTYAKRAAYIVDCKIGDIGNTNDAYCKCLFDNLSADAITVHNYMGHEAMRPLLDRKEKGIIVLGKTSNEKSDEFQNRRCVITPKEGSTYDSRFLFEVVAKNVADPKMWNYNNNCLLVAGATYPGELQSIRNIVGHIILLIPGIGAQGGDLESTLKAGFNSKKEGVIINSSRGIIYASSQSDFAEKAREETWKLHNAINSFRE